MKRNKDYRLIYMPLENVIQGIDPVDESFETKLDMISHMMFTMEEKKCVYVYFKYHPYEAGKIDMHFSEDIQDVMQYFCGDYFDIKELNIFECKDYLDAMKYIREYMLTMEVACFDISCGDMEVNEDFSVN